MTHPVTKEILQRRANAGLIVAFLVFLWLPTADTFLHLDPTPTPNENRAPARFPDFKPELAAMHEYVRGIESYFGDHFGFRSRLVAWEHHWKSQIFRSSKKTHALTGKSGWLYFSGGLMADDIMGNRPFSEGDLEAWGDLIKGRRDWLAQRGIRYLFVIAPDKHTIYPEHLPDWLAKAARPPQRLDQLVNYMKGHSDVPVLDLRQAIFEAKKNGRVYLQTDTHWNELGAFAAGRRIVEKVGSLGLAAKASDLSAFESSKTNKGAGDIARMLGKDKTMLEMDEVSLTPKPPLKTVLPRIDTSLVRKNWIPGTEPLLSENPDATVRAVIFRDSFGTALGSFLGYSFARVVYIWQQNWDKRIIESEKPDIVVDEMLERFLISRDPLELKKKDEQPDAQIFGDR